MNICFHTSTIKCENCMPDSCKGSVSYQYVTNVAAQPTSIDEQLDEILTMGTRRAKEELKKLIEKARLEAVISEYQSMNSLNKSVLEYWDMDEVKKRIAELKAELEEKL